MKKAHYIIVITSLVSVRCELLISGSLCRSLSLTEDTSSGLLAGVVSGRLELSLLLKSLDNIVVLPSNLVGETSDSAVLSSWLQSENPQSLWHDNSLLEIVWWWDSLENLQAGESGLTSGGLVGDHTADDLVEDTGRGAEMERTVVLVVSGGLAEVGVVLQLRSEKLAGNVERLASYDNDLLAVEELFGNS